MGGRRVVPGGSHGFFVSNQLDAYRGLHQVEEVSRAAAGKRRDGVHLIFVDEADYTDRGKDPCDQLALCRLDLGEKAAGASLLREVLALQPGHLGATKVLAQL